MKKTLILAAFFAAVAMASFGGNALSVHAQTATNSTTLSDTATLQQQLDNAKAELVYLQMQAGQVPTGDSQLPGSRSAVTAAPVPASTLSATDVSSMQTALTALAGMLVSLQTKIAQDPQFVASNSPVVISALQDIGKTVAVIGTEMTSGNIAMATPQSATQSSGSSVSGSTGSSATGNAGTGSATQPAAVAQANPAQIAPITPVAGSDTTGNTSANTAPQTAQASSSFSFAKLNWPLIVVIILIIAAIAIWLWWDDSEDKKQPAAKANSPAPQRPVQQPLQSGNQVSMSSNQGQNANRQPANPQTPLSSTMAPHGNR